VERPGSGAGQATLPCTPPQKPPRRPSYVTVAIQIQGGAGSAPDLAAWFQGAAINTDRSLRLQYLAGMSVNVFAQEQIISALLNARKIPPGLFAERDRLGRLGGAESLTVFEPHSRVFGDKAVPG
jgi:hypothetical protein